MGTVIYTDAEFGEFSVETPEWDEEFEELLDEQAERYRLYHEELDAGFPLGPTDEQMGFGRPWDQPEPRLTWDLKHLRQPVLDPACICLDPDYHTIPF